MFNKIYAFAGSFGITLTKTKAVKSGNKGIKSGDP